MLTSNKTKQNIEDIGCSHCNRSPSQVLNAYCILHTDLRGSVIQLFIFFYEGVMF